MNRDIYLNRKGQAMLETALVLMIIVVFTFGITEFGRAMYIKNMLNNAARAGARQAVVTGALGASPNPTLPFTYNQNDFPINDTSTQKNIIGTRISDSLFYVGDKKTVSATVLCSAGATATTGSTITVTVTLNNFTPVVAIMRKMISSTLAGQASMRYE